MNRWLALLLLAAPAAVLAEVLHASPLVTFVLASLGLVPLAGYIGLSTEVLAERLGHGIGGLLNATFGNAAEIIIGLTALAAGLPQVVQASLAGSIIGNVLLVLGTSMLVGGWRYRKQQFHPRVAGQYAAMLFLAVIGMAIPSLLATTGGSTRPGTGDEGRSGVPRPPGAEELACTSGAPRCTLPRSTHQPRDQRDGRHLPPDGHAPRLRLAAVGARRQPGRIHDDKKRQARERAGDAVARACVIVPDRLSERSRGVRFAAANDAPLFGVIVTSVRMVPTVDKICGVDGSMIGFVAQTKRGRYDAAIITVAD